MVDALTGRSERVSLTTVFAHLPYRMIILFALAWGFDVASPLAVFGGDFNVHIVKYAVSLPILVVLLLGFRRGEKLACVEGAAGWVCVIGIVGSLLGIVPYVSDTVSLVDVTATAAFILLLVFRILMIIISFIAIARLPLRETLCSLLVWQIFCSAYAVLAIVVNADFMNLATVALSFILTALPHTASQTSDWQVRDFTLRETLHQVPLKLVVIQMLVMIVFRVLIDSSNVSTPPHLGAFLAVIPIAAFYVFSRRPFSLKLLYDLTLIVMELAIFFMVLQGDFGRISSIISGDCASALYTVFLLSILSNICLRHQSSPYVSMVITILGFSVGNLLAAGFLYVAFIFQISQAVYLFAFGILLVIAFVFFSTEHDYQTSWDTDSGESYRMNLIDYYDSLAGRCSMITNRYGLSRREEDVLILLAQAKTSSDIADELCVSIPTVKTHTQSIYQKIGIHSKSELLEIIGYPHTSGITDDSV